MSQTTLPVRVVLVDDSALFRHGLAGLLRDAGQTVVAELASEQPLDAVLDSNQVDVVIVDVRMPPTFTDEGLLLALKLRATRPTLGTIVLSAYPDVAWARRLLAVGSSGVGYLLKDRVADVDALIAAIHRVRDGSSAVDPELVAELLKTSSMPSTLDVLTPKEHDVLRLMAEGFSNVGIAKELFLSPRTVETHITSIFDKLPLESGTGTLNRRVLAVLAYLDDRHDRDVPDGVNG